MASFSNNNKVKICSNAKQLSKKRKQNKKLTPNISKDDDGIRIYMRIQEQNRKSIAQKKVEELSILIKQKKKQQLPKIPIYV